MKKAIIYLIQAIVGVFHQQHLFDYKFQVNRFANSCNTDDIKPWCKPVCIYRAAVNAGEQVNFFRTDTAAIGADGIDGYRTAFAAADLQFCHLSAGYRVGADDCAY